MQMMFLLRNIFANYVRPHPFLEKYCRLYLVSTDRSGVISLLTFRVYRLELH